MLDQIRHAARGEAAVFLDSARKKVDLRPPFLESGSWWSGPAKGDRQHGAAKSRDGGDR